MRIAKWETFQGYQKTGPKWIKLHAGLIDKPEWMRLPLVAKAVLPMLWIAASRSGSTGELPDEPAIVAMLCHMKESEVLEALPSLTSAGFIECEGFVASPAKDLSQPVRDECRPRERESREREEREISPGRVVKAESTATPDGTPVKLSDVDGTTATAPRRLTPQALGIRVDPANFAQVQLSHDLTALVTAWLRDLGSEPADPKDLAVRALHDISTTPAGKRIETLDLRRVPTAWATVSSHAAYKLAAEVYGVDLATVGATDAPVLASGSGGEGDSALGRAPSPEVLKRGIIYLTPLTEGA